MTATTLSAPASNYQAGHRSRTSGRGPWTRARNAVRQWFARTQLGPIDNYVTR